MGGVKALPAQINQAVAATPPGRKRPVRCRPAPSLASPSGRLWPCWRHGMLAEPVSEPEFPPQADANEVQKLRERKAAADAALQAAQARFKAAKDAAVRAEEAFARGAGTKAAMDVRCPPLPSPTAPRATHAHTAPSAQAALASRASVQAAVEQAESGLAAANSALQSVQSGPHAGQAAARKCVTRCLPAGTERQTVRSWCAEPPTPAGAPRPSPPCLNASAPEWRPSRARRTRRMTCPWTTRTGAKSSWVRRRCTQPSACQRLRGCLTHHHHVQAVWLRTAASASTTRGGIVCRVRLHKRGASNLTCAAADSRLPHALQPPTGRTKSRTPSS